MLIEYTYLLLSIVGGDWAGVGSVFNGAGCPGDCVGQCLALHRFDFVDN